MSCSITTGTYFYDRHPVSHPGGPWRIQTLPGGTLFDTYLHLYRGSFNPLNPCLNIVGTNDDNGEGLMALIDGTFPAGNYIIVVTSFRMDDTGTYFLLPR